MILAREQETVLKVIGELGAGNSTVPVPLGGIHDRVPDMDVRDLVRHLEILLSSGLIENARPGREKIGNSFFLTSRGLGYLEEKTAPRR